MLCFHHHFVFFLLSLRAAYVIFVYSQNKKQASRLEIHSFPLSTYMWTFKMPSSIRLFQFIQKYYRFCGVYPSQPSHNHHSFNAKKCVFIICGVQYLISSIFFLLFEAKSMLEYEMACYIALWIIFTTGTYLIPAWQMKRTLEFNEYCESFIEASKFIIYQVRNYSACISS